MSDQCPSCGDWYCLSVCAPPLPWVLEESGSDEEIEAWEAEHNYNIVVCSFCGYRSDEE